MWGHAVAGCVLVVLALAQAALNGIIASHFGAKEKRTWYRFFDRWGFSLILLMAALYEFTKAGWLHLPKVLLLSFAGVIAAATFAAAAVRGR